MRPFHRERPALSSSVSHAANMKAGKPLLNTMASHCDGGGAACAGEPEVRRASCDPRRPLEAHRRRGGGVQGKEPARAIQGPLPFRATGRCAGRARACVRSRRGARSAPLLGPPPAELFQRRTPFASGLVPTRGDTQSSALAQDPGERPSEREAKRPTVSRFFNQTGSTVATRQSFPVTGGIAH